METTGAYIFLYVLSIDYSCSHRFSRSTPHSGFSWDHRHDGLLGTKEKWGNWNKYDREHSFGLVAVIDRWQTISAVVRVTLNFHFLFFLGLHCYISLSEWFYFIFFPSTEVLMNTKSETSDLKWTIFSRARPEVCNLSFSMLSVFLTQTSMVTGGIFGFQLCLCYFGYERVPYMAGNWQKKGNTRANVGFGRLKADALI